MIDPNVVKKEGGWLETITEKIKGISSYFLLEILAYLAGGFISGFLIKYFGRYIIWLFVVLFLGLWILETLGIISVNYFYVQSFFGITTEATLNQNINNFFIWLRNHIPHTIAFFLGLYFAWELT